MTQGRGTPRRGVSDESVEETPMLSISAAI